MLLQGLWVIFAATGAGPAIQPDASAALCLVLECVMMGAVLQQCHHGVSTAQVKGFLQEIDLDAAHGKWDTWLPAHHSATLLGSRWMVSTKAVFLGLGTDAAARSGLVTRNGDSALAGVSDGLGHRRMRPVHESEGTA